MNATEQWRQRPDNQDKQKNAYSGKKNDTL